MNLQLNSVGDQQMARSDQAHIASKERSVIAIFGHAGVFVSPPPPPILPPSPNPLPPPPPSSRYSGLFPLSKVKARSNACPFTKKRKKRKKKKKGSRLINNAYGRANVSSGTAIAPSSRYSGQFPLSKVKAHSNACPFQKKKRKKKREKKSSRLINNAYGRANVSSGTAIAHYGAPIGHTLTISF